MTAKIKKYSELPKLNNSDQLLLFKLKLNFVKRIYGVVYNHINNVQFPLEFTCGIDNNINLFNIDNYIPIISNIINPSDANFNELKYDLSDITVNKTLIFNYNDLLSKLIKDFNAKNKSQLYKVLPHLFKIMYNIFNKLIVINNTIDNEIYNSIQFAEIQNYKIQNFIDVIKMETSEMFNYFSSKQQYIKLNLTNNEIIIYSKKIEHLTKQILENNKLLYENLVQSPNNNSIYINIHKFKVFMKSMSQFLLLLGNISNSFNSLPNITKLYQLLTHIFEPADITNIETKMDLSVYKYNIAISEYFYTVYINKIINYNRNHHNKYKNSNYIQNMYYQIYYLVIYNFIVYSYDIDDTEFVNVIPKCFDKIISIWKKINVKNDFPIESNVDLNILQLTLIANFIPNY